jgi:hypothetical protein
MEQEAITISCDECVRKGTSTCDECVVSYVLERDRAGAIVIDAAEARAVRLLQRAGLVPKLRHERRVG